MSTCILKYSKVHMLCYSYVTPPASGTKISVLCIDTEGYTLFTKWSPCLGQCIFRPEASITQDVKFYASGL